MRHLIRIALGALLIYNSGMNKDTALPDSSVKGADNAPAFLNAVPPEQQNIVPNNNSVATEGRHSVNPNDISEATIIEPAADKQGGEPKQ